MERTTSEAPRSVKLPAARTLAGFQSQACSAFGHDRVRLYLNGTTRIRDPNQMALVQDGDFVVVREDDSPRAPRHPMMSSHQADFRPHPVQQRTPRGAQEAVPVGEKFEGQTENKRAYYQQPLARMQPIKPGPTSIPTRAGPTLSSSIYKADFLSPGQFQNQQSRGVDKSRRPDTSPFQGQSSYSTSYVKHTPPEARGLLRPPPHTVRRLPFEANSTSRSDFLLHSSRPQPPCKPPESELQKDLQHGEPFKGSTEYESTFHSAGDYSGPKVTLQPGARPSDAPRGQPRISPQRDQPP